MDAVITSLYNGLPIFMLHGGTAILMLIVGAFIYSKITPWNELDLIMEGNTAAAVSFSGAILGIAIPLAAALSSSIVFGRLLSGVRLQSYCKLPSS